MRKGMKKKMYMSLGAMMAAGMLSGCGASDQMMPSSNSNGNDEIARGTEEHVDLKMYLVGDKPEDFDEVYDEVNKILNEKLNCTLSVDWLNWSEHETKYSLLFSSGEDFDMIFTATSWCHFEQTVALGGFRALDEQYIQTYAPDIWEDLPEMAWEQATLNGNIYMIPANFTQITPDAYAIRGDLMKEYGVEDVSCYEDLVEFYKLCAQNGTYANLSGGLYWPWFADQGYQIISGAPNQGDLILFHGADASDTEIKYILDWDEFTEYCYQAKELADAGCWPADTLSSTQERQDGLVTGRAATMYWNIGSCANYANQANAEHPEWNVNVYNVAKDYTYTGTMYINGGIGINAMSKNPERALMVINEFATNPDIQDLTQLGIKGVHWEPVGEKQYKVIEGNAYNTSNNWGWRNLDLMRTEYQENPTAVDKKRAEIEAYYPEHVRNTHPLDGFSFDATPVSTQYAAVEAAMGNYHDPLVCGLVDDVDVALEEYRNAMESAGIRDVIEEMQRQVDEYLKLRQ